MYEYQSNKYNTFEKAFTTSVYWFLDESSHIGDFKVQHVMVVRLRWLHLPSQTALEYSFLLSVAKQNNRHIFKLIQAMLITTVTF